MRPCPVGILLPLPLSRHPATPLAGPSAVTFGADLGAWARRAGTARFLPGHATASPAGRLAPCLVKDSMPL